MQNNILEYFHDRRLLILSTASIIFVLGLKHLQLFSTGNLVFDALQFILLTVLILISARSISNRAEYLAHKYGEPHGTLILTFTSVMVEMIMLCSIMLHEQHEPMIARDTVYSVIMIVINGLIGISIFLGAMKHGEQKYNLKSSNSYFSMILAFVGISLVLPNFIPPASIHYYEIFLIVISILVYLVFVRIQTKEHRHFFTYEQHSTERHQIWLDHQQNSSGWYQGILLFFTLVIIGYLANTVAIIIDDASTKMAIPNQAAALYIAILILAPEGLTAIRAGLNNEMQRVINVCLGSVLSTITLTIPAVLLIGLIFDRHMILGITQIQAVMLFLTLFVGMNSYRHGETNAIQGIIHSTLFVTYIVLMFTHSL